MKTRTSIVITLLVLLNLALVVFLLVERLGDGGGMSGRGSGASGTEGAGQDGGSRGPQEYISRVRRAVVSIKSGNNLGTGFYISASGRIVTNSHIVNSESEVIITTVDGDVFVADVIREAPPPLDLAILQSRSTAGNDAVVLGDSEQCREGDEVVAIGFPMDLSYTVTKGIISACNRPHDDYPQLTYLQTDTPINSGNSGGPLLNERGEVVGINTLKVTGVNVEGLGFALSINVLRDFLADRLVFLERALRREHAVTLQMDARQREQQQQREMILQQVERLKNIRWDNLEAGAGYERCAAEPRTVSSAKDSGELRRIWSLQKRENHAWMNAVLHELDCGAAQGRELARITVDPYDRSVKSFESAADKDVKAVTPEFKQIQSWEDPCGYNVYLRACGYL